MLAVAAVAATIVTGCSHTPAVKPASIVFACGDGNFYASALRWSHWGAGDAEATGSGHQNDCMPNCAAGRFHVYPLAVRLSRPVECVAGRREFSRLAWRFTAAKPAGVPRSGSETLPCAYLKQRP